MFPSPYGESFSKYPPPPGARDGNSLHSFRPLTGNHLVNAKKILMKKRGVKSFRPLTGNHLVNQLLIVLIGYKPELVSVPLRGII